MYQNQEEHLLFERAKILLLYPTGSICIINVSCNIFFKTFIETILKLAVEEEEVGNRNWKYVNYEGNIE